MVAIAHRRISAVVAAWVSVVCVVGGTALAFADGSFFSASETARIVAMGPWPPALSPDPTNRASGKQSAIDLGERLFFDRRLSLNGKLACASCHHAEHSWTDGLARGQGLAKLDRNTLPLFELRERRWFAWDGAADSLWSQSIRPILDARELGASPEHVAKFVRSDPDTACRYRQVFGAGPGASDDETVLVNVGKVLAAFQETLSTGRASFDDYRDAVASGDRIAMSHYPESAKRGLKLFLGRAQCSVCHIGPNFTNGEFHDIGISHFVERGRVDKGRYGGIEQLRRSPFNLLGKYNDDPKRADGASALSAKHVAAEHRNFGEFRTPSLRQLMHTAPYMHNGSMGSLREVVQYYNTINVERLHADGESILKPLGLSEREVTDLVVFLESLTNHRGGYNPKPLHAREACQ
jgi:cytochrome c peroxidase